MIVSPPGGLPYHDNEIGRDLANDNIIVKTGLLGIGLMFLCAFWTVCVLVVSSPFLLLGLAEVVEATPAHYRVRWIRKDPS